MTCRQVIVGAALVALALPLRGQGLAFDHWLNAYLEVAAASAAFSSADRSVWPQERAAVVPLARAGLTLPGWVTSLMAEEVRRERRAPAGTAPAQWDAWRVGVRYLSGEREASRRRGGGYYLFGDGVVHMSDNVYAYIRVRATPDSAEVPAFTGYPREKRRLGLHAAECDYAYLQYGNAWFTARFGRFKESWGPGDARSVWLSAWGPAYDGLLVELRYRRLRFRAMSTYLETVVDPVSKGNVHRYLAAHMLTYTNGRTLWIGFGEGMLYAGVDRPLSIAYSNPFMLYQEYERNYRTNELSKNRDNWFLTGWWEWFPWPPLRTWGMLMIDDVQLDREPIPDATAVRVGLSYCLGGRTWPVVRYDYVRISSWTYRHQTPHINCVARGLPLGFSEGSDLEFHELSCTAFPMRYVMAQAFVRAGRQGELSVVDDPYRLREFPHHWDFPWGVVERRVEAGLGVRVQPRHNLMAEVGFRWGRAVNAGNVQGDRRSEVVGFVRVAGYGEVGFYGTADSAENRR